MSRITAHNADKEHVVVVVDCGLNVYHILQNLWLYTEREHRDDRIVSTILKSLSLEQADGGVSYIISETIAKLGWKINRCAQNCSIPAFFLK